MPVSRTTIETIEIVFNDKIYNITYTDCPEESYSAVTFTNGEILNTFQLSEGEWDAIQLALLAEGEEAPSPEVNQIEAMIAEFIITNFKRLDTTKTIFLETVDNVVKERI